MRLLLDSCLSPQLKQPLTIAGHDVEHARDIGLGKADDDIILDYARREDRIVVTQDRDFGALLAGSGLNRPSLVYLRVANRRPGNHARLLVASLPIVEQDLLGGAIVVLTDAGIRIRSLPIP